MANPGSYYPSHQMPIKGMRFFTQHIGFISVLDKKTLCKTSIYVPISCEAKVTTPV